MALVAGVSNGDLLRANDAAEIWLIENDQRRWIPDAATLLSKWTWDKVRTVTADVIAAIPRGTDYPSVVTQNFADGTLLQVAGQANVYVMEGGQRRWIPDPATFAAEGYKWENVRNISEPEMNAIPLGPPLSKARTALSIPQQTKDLQLGHFIQTKLDMTADRRVVGNTFLTCTNKISGFTAGIQLIYTNQQGDKIGVWPRDGSDNAPPWGIDQAPIIGANHRSIDWFDTAPVGTADISLTQFWAPKDRFDSIFSAMKTVVDDIVKAVQFAVTFCQTYPDFCKSISTVFASSGGGDKPAGDIGNAPEEIPEGG